VQKRLFFDVIPKNVDEYLTQLSKYAEQAEVEKIENPVWHIHNGMPPFSESGLSFSILLNLASVCNTEDKSVLWSFVERYIKGATPEAMPFLDKLIMHAIAYYQDFIKPQKQFKAPTEIDTKAIKQLKEGLMSLPENADSDAIQFLVFETGKQYPYDSLRDWFKSLYEVLLGQNEGPRMGSFIALYGVQNMIALMEENGL
jgi:lysyl-tRNA synthetase class 1